MSGEATPEPDGAQVQAELDRLVRRLRLLSPRSWRDFRGVIQDAIAQLVAIAARQQQRDLTPPDLPDHMLADAVAVIGHDLLDSAREPYDESVGREVARIVEDALARTR